MKLWRAAAQAGATAAARGWCGAAGRATAAVTGARIVRGAIIMPIVLLEKLA